MPLLEAIELDPIVRSLTGRRESKHFLLRYAMRNPKTGVGSGAHGVRRSALIGQYVKALEMAWRALTEEPWKRPPPVSDGRTPVYIYDTQDPMTIPFQWRLPAVILRSRSEEPVVRSELHRASADAVHLDKLVVSNCGTRPEPANTRLPHDDGQQFKIEVSAE